MILHAVQIHTESSQSCHSLEKKTPNNQLIKHIYLGRKNSQQTDQGMVGGEAWNIPAKRDMGDQS